MAENTDTVTVDLTRGEARVVVAALADEEMTASDDRGRRLQEVQDRLAAAFEVDQYRTGDGGETADDEWSPGEWLDEDGPLDPDDTAEVTLSRAGADAVRDALAAFELDERDEDAGTAEAVRRRIADAVGG
ncbi:hypothetical protein [Halorussus marinus]|uniref:hypothetical protein n=1 Tax=Halorussus marinus TaxID=2505976 RepID=UPI001431C82E|nr:hypothetical protein [Halorussus marinus]